MSEELPPTPPPLCRAFIYLGHSLQSYNCIDHICQICLYMFDKDMFFFSQNSAFIYLYG